MNAMLAYNADPQLRAELIEEVEEHRRRDQIVKGHYDGCEDGRFTGCAVGCTIDSYNRRRGAALECNDHGAYETFGIPRVLARLQDVIFENLPDDLALEWPARFLRATPCGADLSRVWPQFALFLLRDCRPHAQPDGQAAMNRVIGLYERQIAGESLAIGEWRSAQRAAARAAGAAADAADAAYAAAWARFAAELERLLSAA